MNESKIYCKSVGPQASRAGVRPGDELLAVNDEPISKNHFYEVAAAIRGKAGTKVRLYLKHSDGRRYKVNLTRTIHKAPTIRLMQKSKEPILKIIRFSAETPAELLGNLRVFRKSKQIIIDLRDNEGGDMEAAIKAAALFLPPETPIVTLRLKNGEPLSFRSHNIDYAKSKSILLLQNHRTASAAELFIGALVANQRARSQGERSYGKGVAQRFFPLADGGALLISYAIIYLPDGRTYHKIGLTPTIEQ
jgi:carboxyl-terminal processing protease